MGKLLAVIRLRGIPDRSPQEEKTLELLRLHRRFNAIILPDSPEVRGMLKRVEYVVTYGEIDEEMLALLLERRGRLYGNKRLSLDFARKLGFEDFSEMARALLKGEASLKDLNVKSVFRLAPPSRGFKGSLKKHFRDGGELGYRGEAINDLLRRMA